MCWLSTWILTKGSDNHSMLELKDKRCHKDKLVILKIEKSLAPPLNIKHGFLVWFLTYLAESPGYKDYPSYFPRNVYLFNSKPEITTTRTDLFPLLRYTTVIHTHLLKLKKICEGQWCLVKNSVDNGLNPQPSSN